MKKLFILLLSFLSITSVSYGAGTLYEYYTQNDGVFPSCEERAFIYEDIFSDTYICSAEQNIQLLYYLQSQNLGSAGVVVKPGTIGVPVVSGTAGSVLFIDASGNLGEDNSNIYWNNTSNYFGLGTTSPWGLFSVNPNALGANVPSLVVGSSTATTFIIDNAGKVGVSTTSPYAKFSVTGSTGSLVPIFTVASSTHTPQFQIDSYGHRMTGGTAPTCGANCAAISGDDNSMRVTTGVGVSSATVNFANTWKNGAGTAITPTCHADEENAGVVAVNASSTSSTVVLEFASALSSILISVSCQASLNFTF